jgi:lipid-A-disaccharide synthase
VSLVVPVDFGGFNICLCREAARRGVPVFYYIPPQVWAHGRYRLKKLRKWTTRCGLIYPFEAPLYRRWGVEAEYVGHPLFDEIEQSPPSEEAVAELKDRFGANLIGVFPGSRRQEVRAHVPMLIEACRRIRRTVADARFALLCPAEVGGLVADLLPEEAGLDLIEGVTPVELARASRLCIAKSGTVTLEIASQGTPTVVFYRAMAFAAFMGYGLADTPYMCTVNVLAGRMICPERLMVRPRPDWLAEQALRPLGDPTAHEGCRADIARALRGFDRPGASVRAARSALSLVR